MKARATKTPRICSESLAKPENARALDLGIFERAGRRHAIFGDRLQQLTREIAAPGIADEHGSRRAVPERRASASSLRPYPV